MIVASPQNCRVIGIVTLCISLSQVYQAYGDSLGVNTTLAYSNAVPSRPQTTESSLPIAKLASSSTTEWIPLTDLTMTSVLSDTQLGYNTLFPKCNPPCENDGVCRLVGNITTQPKCICPVDYKGIDCKEDSEPELKFCDESTCKNGGMCAGTAVAPFCSCPTDILGRTCERRVRSYEVNLLLMNANKILTWNASFANPISSLYKNISSKVLNAVDTACKLGPDLRLVQSYYGSEFLGFSNGSLHARVKVKFDFDDQIAKNYSEARLRRHIQSGGLLILKSEYLAKLQPQTDFGMQNASAFTLEAVNPCTSGNNDCSVNADCTVVAPGVYTCMCKAFTIDSSLNKAYPGRRCFYDGLIIFSFILVGSLISILIFLLCGCRRTIWYRYKNRGHPEHLTLVNMPSNYDI